MVFACSSIAGAEPRRVLLINSFGREFAPFDVFAGNFRAELVRQSSQPVDVYEVSLESARFSFDPQGAPTAEYLRTKANAPVFGLHDTQLGRGIVGGPLMAIGDLSRNTAQVAARILSGESVRLWWFEPSHLQV